MDALNLVSIIASDSSCDFAQKTDTVGDTLSMQAAATYLVMAWVYNDNVVSEDIPYILFNKLKKAGFVTVASPPFRGSRLIEQRLKLTDKARKYLTYAAGNVVEAG